MAEEPALKRTKKAKAPKLYEQVGYTNETNPFGDSDLGRKFVWKKREAGPSAAAAAAAKVSSGASGGGAREKREHYLSEIEKVRKRRQDREDELEERERLRDEEQRLREAETYDDWQAKEEDFHLEQTKVRSRLRLANHRSKPIDLVAKNILMIEEAEFDARGEALGEREAEAEAAAAKGGAGVKYTSFRKDEQTMRTDLKALDVELRHPASIVRGGALTSAELAELREAAAAYLHLEEETEGAEFVEFWRAFVAVCDYEAGERRAAPSGGRGSRPVHGAVTADVAAMFQGKSVAELSSLREGLQAKLDDPDSDDDEDPEYWKHVLRECDFARALGVLNAVHADLLRRQLTVIEARKALLTKAQSDTSAAAAAVPEAQAPGAAVDASSAAVDMEEREAERGSAEDEELMVAAAEVALGAKPLWASKYEPRKPRYLNRVKTGYEWNKYNQTHFTHEEPPPKVVQGYKFNLFYPDLINRNDLPTFVLEKCPEAKDLAIIRFTAGPPYEDVAFKIVNQEWERGSKKGYRCVFERGILQLHFNFKRWRYRR